MQGKIVKALSGFYYVDTPDGVVACRARGKFRRAGLSPLVGDEAEITVLPGGEGVVEQLLPRRNAFERPAAANLDLLVILASAVIPKTDPFLIDRMCAVAALKNCEVLLCINKCDLDPADALFSCYTAAKIPTLRVSAKTGEGVEALRDALAGKTAAFTGNSGVGKSSLLNALSPQLALKTGEVSTALGRGRHTTRHVELFRLENGAQIMDTPGFSSFESEGLDFELKRRLPETFVDFAPYLGQCRFLGCSHTGEKGCAVLDAVRRGDIQPSRHASYVRLYEELKPLRDWQEKK